MLLPVVWIMSGHSLFPDGAGNRKAVELMLESLRPRFHFTARTGWINDPNGLVYFGGEYHLFFQHNPFSTQDGIKAWGHAVSRDLMHWQQLDDAIMPDELGAIWSGSAVVDQQNTSGLGTKGRPPMVAFYTAAGGTTPASAGKPFTQCIAFSTDRGRTWAKYAGNPVLAHIADQNRDPRVFWYAPRRRWIMALYLTGNDYGLFGSPDLIHWQRLSTVTMPGSSECPDMFELPIDGEPGATRWIFVGGDGRYFIGSFDGTTFTPEAGPLRVDYGPNFYATQTWNDAPRGRRIQIAWMAGGQYPEMPFNQQLTLPFELSLRRNEEGLRMYRRPVRELARLRGKPEQYRNIPLAPGASVTMPAPSDLMEVYLVLQPGASDSVTIQAGSAQVHYSVKHATLHAMGRACPLKLEGGTLSLRLIMDRTSVEVVANEGAATFSGCILPTQEKPRLLVSAAGGAAKLVRAILWPMRPAVIPASDE